MKKVIFLDIDGVLQPFTQHRFKHDMDALLVRLAKEHSNDHFLKLDKYDVAAVFYDWWIPAVRYLRILCENTGARIVISSNWRQSKTVEDLSVLMSIYDLGKYVVDFTPGLDYPMERADEIRAYLNGHPDIEHFVVLDDAYISGYKREFPDHYVATRTCLERKHFEQAALILTGNPEPWFKTHAKKVFFLHPDSLLDMDEGKSWWESPQSLRKKLIEKNENFKTLKAKDIWDMRFSCNRESSWFLAQMCERWEVSVVIPAAWSKKYDLEQIKLLLSVAEDALELGQYVIEVTPPHRKGAGHEIQTYLREHPHIEQFVIGENTADSPLYEMFPEKVVNWKRRQKDLVALRSGEDVAYREACLLMAGGEPVTEDRQNPGFFAKYDL